MFYFNYYYLSPKNMKKLTQGNLLIALIAWGTILFSVQSIIYYTRWLIPLLADHPSYIAPPVKFPQLWFVAKIASNGIFLWVGFLLLRLYRKYQRCGYFDKDSLKVLDRVIIACLSLAFLGFVQTIFENAPELHTEQWSSLWSISNLVFRFFTRQLVQKEPQTMYLLLAAILWGVRQFVVQALHIKKENELFI